MIERNNIIKRKLRATEFAMSGIHRMPRCFLILLLVAAGLVSPTTHAGDWPQILGPFRNGVAAEDERLATSWPEDGPPLVWEKEVGTGFAGVAVSDGKVLLFHRMRDQEVVEVLDAEDSGVTWSKGYPTSFVPQYGRDDGPLCVPTIAGERIITLGAGGVLTCWRLDDGEVIWRRETQREFDVLEGYFGAGSCPLVHGETVIVNVGDRDAEAGLVAFDLASGAVAWTAVSDGASYSSPVVTEIDGAPTVIALTRFKCVGVDVADGAVRFDVPFGMRGLNVTAANPVLVGESVFLSASYGIGALYGSIGSDGFQQVWSNNDVMSSQYTTCIEHDGLLFGIDGRQDIPPATLRCLDLKTGDVKWSVEEFGYATLLKADGKLLIAGTDGEFHLAELSGVAYRPLARARLFDDTVRALPALSGGRLFARDSSRLRCFDLGPPND